MTAAIAPVVEHLKRTHPGDAVGLYRYGSGIRGEPGPHSDVDLLVLTRRSLSTGERTALVEVLLSSSGWTGHAERFPEAVDRQPIDLTSLVISEVQPLTASPHRDFQFGEWLRQDLLAGTVPAAEYDPDVVMILATALSAHRVECGPALESLIAPVPHPLLTHAQLALVPELIQELPGDERNVLLTLARILCTVETREIVTKDVAAERIAQRLHGAQRKLMELARRDYLGEVGGRWSEASAQAEDLAHTLAGLIREAAANPAQGHT